MIAGTPARLMALLAALGLSVAALLAPGAARAACNVGACVQAGPRLASVSTQQGTLANALFGSLLGTSVNLSVLDWNNIADGDISLVSLLSTAQTTLGVSSPAQALAANATLAQLISVAAGAAQADGYTASATALNALTIPVSGLTSTLSLGSLLKVQFPSGSLTTTKINAFDLVSGLVQLYNYQNVATTSPTPATVSGGSLGLGSVINSMQLYAQVVEPPVVVCGTTGDQFFSAAIRVKLDINLVALHPNASTLNVLTIAGASVTIGHLELYVDVARAQGTIGVIDAVSRALSVQATPGVADIYVGHINDNVFFLRGRTINEAVDIQYSDIGTLSLSVLGIPITVSIQVWTFGNGAAPFQSTLNFTGPYPQTLTASTSAVFINNLVTGAVQNLHVRLSPLLGGLLDGALAAPLKTLVGTALSPVLTSVLSNGVDPLLELVGIKLGQVEVTALGTALVCGVSGSVYQDANHNSHLDGFESGTGLTLYAKLVASTSPTGPALQVATVNTTTGAYSFSNVWPASYIVLIDTTNTLSDVTVTASTGWIPTEIPTLSRNDITMVDQDVTGKNFGLFNGSRLSGRVFNDSGTSGGTANNGVRDGAEAGLSGVTVRVTDSTGTTTQDTAVSGGDGAYTLWVAAAAAGNVALRVVETNPATALSTGGSAGTTGGSYTRATDAVSFTNVVGSGYTGVDFADVSQNTWLANAQKAALPGTAVLYGHTFTANSTGQVSFTIDSAANPDASSWTDLLYLDANCNGTLDSGEVLLSGAMSAVAGQKVCVVMKTTVPTNAAFNRQHQITLTASFSYTNASPALNASQTLTELTLVGDSADGALRLSKGVDKATAKSGDALTYTITYVNLGSEPLGALKISDATPSYTTFTSAACGTLPAGITGCSPTQQPAVGASGAVQWTFTGTLTPGASGTVTLVVTLQ